MRKKETREESLSKADEKEAEHSSSFICYMSEKTAALLLKPRKWQRSLLQMVKACLCFWLLTVTSHPVTFVFSMLVPPQDRLRGEQTSGRTRISPHQENFSFTFSLFSPLSGLAEDHIYRV